MRLSFWSKLWKGSCRHVSDALGIQDYKFRWKMRKRWPSMADRIWGEKTRVRVESIHLTHSMREHLALGAAGLKYLTRFDEEVLDLIKHEMREKKSIDMSSSSEDFKKLTGDVDEAGVSKLTESIKDLIDNGYLDGNHVGVITLSDRNPDQEARDALSRAYSRDSDARSLRRQQTLLDEQSGKNGVQEKPASPTGRVMDSSAYQVLNIIKFELAGKPFIHMLGSRDFEILMEKFEWMSDSTMRDTVKLLIDNGHLAGSHLGEVTMPSDQR